MRPFAGILLFCLALGLPVRGQELNARVSVNSERIQGTNRNVFTTMERALNQFINGTQWSAAPFSTNERIECTFSVIILEQPSDNMFRAELMVQSSRPVYNSSYITSMLNYRDVQFEFEYTENAVIQMQQNALNNNLEAVIAFYANLILALDFDSFSLLGGSLFFRQAQQIATMAQSAGWGGWSAFDDSKSRGSMITAYSDEGLKAYRENWYIYHRKGLDEMAANPDRARITALGAVAPLKDLRPVRFSEIPLQMFADTKLDEVVSIASKATADERKELYTLLRNLYPTQSGQLEPLSKN
jgi:hypothetical protein